ncbi:CDP-glucose 4,6-dehydratase [Agarilytica rhodophyticola]|uniref:CDP-glucose 4,6-dehydratase n=1 Tax=Agarilytica rhodophyticola TaxID=1737490 RepID=UPI000B3428FA|nr:CDP-glucose 4,6-dehydratase [Agarilytica rhodophyticola]
MINPLFWRGKRVFITGHTGFKGSWLSLWLQRMGADICGYSLVPPTQPNMFEAANIANGMRSTIGDIRDHKFLLKTMSDFRPEIVIHMAAQPLVRLSYDEPIDTYSTNVMGTVNVLDCVRKILGVRAVVNVTSDKCYDNKEWCWGYREDEPKGGYDPYSNSKGCAELVTDAFRNSYFNASKYEDHGCAVASARAGNVIGGGDWALDRLIPDMLSAFESEQSVEIRNPHAIRPWQHVLEPLSGYLMLAQHLYISGVEYSEGWNFGPNEQDAKSVEWIVHQLSSLWGEGAKWHLSNENHPHEASYLKLDCSKAKMRLNWYPRWRLKDTLKKIVDWHKVWLSDADMYEYSLSEIHQYVMTDSK